MIAMLLWINFGSITDTLLAMSVIPMAVIGGVLALFVTGIPFSVRLRSASSRCSALP